MLRVLYHNVQSLHNKLGELSLISSLNHMNMDVLCFTQHWLSSNHINISNIDHFKLVSSVSSNNRGGWLYIFVRKFLQTKEINYLNGIGLEKSFELMDLKIVTVCINNLLMMILMNFCLIWNYWLIGYKMETFNSSRDWNINFLQQSTKLQDLQNLLFTFNLVNMVESPTRLSREANSLIDVTIIIMIYMTNIWWTLI